MYFNICTIDILLNIINIDNVFIITKICTLDCCSYFKQNNNFEFVQINNSEESPKVIQREFLASLKIEITAKLSHVIVKLDYFSFNLVPIRE